MFCSKQHNAFLIAGHARSKSSDWPVGTNIPCMEEECVPLPAQCSHHIAVPPACLYDHDRHTSAAGLYILLLV